MTRTLALCLLLAACNGKNDDTDTDTDTDTEVDTEEPIPLLEELPQTCATYCDIVLDHCTGWYVGDAECLAACEDLSTTGTLGDRSGDSLQCRIAHAYDAWLGDIETCVNAGPDGGSLAFSPDDADGHCFAPGSVGPGWSIDDPIDLPTIPPLGEETTLSVAAIPAGQARWFRLQWDAPSGGEAGEPDGSLSPFIEVVPASSDRLCDGDTELSLVAESVPGVVLGYSDDIGNEGDGPNTCSRLYADAPSEVALATLPSGTYLIKLDSVDPARGIGASVLHLAQHGTPSSDVDADGLTQAVERALGTNPYLADSDDGGAPDGEEFDAGQDPLDPQDDPWIDLDGDGLIDSEEASQGTDRTQPDTDSDGLEDGLEVFGWPGPDTPFDSDPLVADSDEDGLTDGEEFAAGTNPRNADSDADGLTDDLEAANHSDPWHADTDADGLSDADEVLVHNTLPWHADTDRDGRSDALEVTEGTDPLIADVPVQASCALFDAADLLAVLERPGAVCATPENGEVLPGLFGEAQQDPTAQLVGAVWIDTSYTGEGERMDTAVVGVTEEGPPVAWTGCGVFGDEPDAAADAACGTRPVGAFSTIDTATFDECAAVVEAVCP